MVSSFTSSAGLSTAMLSGSQCRGTRDTQALQEKLFSKLDVNGDAAERGVSSDDRAVVRLDDAGADGEAQARCAGVATARRIDAVQAIEQSRQRFVGHAGSRVFHRYADADVAACVGDAHSTAALGYRELGIAQARRAWLTKEQVLNTRPWREIAKLRP